MRGYAAKHASQPPLRSSLADEASWRLGGFRARRVGEADNPGPGQTVRSLKSFLLVTLNCGGAPGAWAALKHYSNYKGAVVLALQETRMLPDEWGAFQRHAHKLGFRGKVAPGLPSVGRWGETRPRGGVALLVDKRLRIDFGPDHVSSDSQVLGATVENWWLSTFYAPPCEHADPQGEAARGLQELFEVTRKDESSAWIACGDANELPGDSTIACTLRAYGGTPLSTGRGSRWSSDREIDWFASSRPLDFALPVDAPFAFSDHKALELTVPLGTVDCQQGFLSPSVSWVKPQDVSSEDWRRWLDAAWTASEAVKAFDSQVAQGSLTVQDAWDVFMRLLHDMFCQAFHTCKSAGFATNSRTGLHANRPKGRIPSWKCRFWARSGNDRQTGSMHITKLRRRLARTYELQRLQSRPQPRRAQGEAEAKTLCTRLGLPQDPWSAEVQAAVKDLVSEVSQELRGAEKAQKTQALQRWRYSILHEPAGLGRWLRRREQVAVTKVSGLGRVARTPRECTALISDFWTQFWDGAQSQGPDEEAIYERLVQWALPDRAHTQWEPPSLPLLVAQARKATGAAGPDHWSGLELRHLPEGALATFRLLALQWEEQGICPEQLTHSRQVNLPKNAKVLNSHVDVGDVRPIAVMSCFWRLWGSAWMQTPSIKHWVSSNTPTELAFGKGSSAPFSATECFEAFAADGFASSLDFTKCYDCMRPLGTVRLMRAGGFPEGLCRLCQAVWCHQKRWLEWGGHVAQLPIHSGHATAQGCPFGPLSLLLWMGSGLTATAHMPGPERLSGLIRVYMDDRTCTARSAEHLVHRVRSWQSWSRSVGLLESATKTRLASRTAQGRRALRALWPQPEQVGDSLEVLGASSQPPVADVLPPKQEARLQSAKAVVTVLGNLRLCFERFHSAARTYGVSKASYGWLAHLPTAKVCWNQWTVLRTGQRSLQRANRHIRAIIFGGTSHLDCLAAGNLLRCLRQLKEAGRIRWHNRRGSPLDALRRWLRERSWTEVSPWKWRGVTPECSLDLSTQSVPQMLHSLRQGWRAEHWRLFQNWPRPEVAELSGITAAQFLRTDFDRTRKAMQESPSYRTVATLASTSPACFKPGVRQNTVRSHLCCWPGCNALGSWRHIAWTCRCRPAHAPRLRGLNLTPVQLRLGWVRKGVRSDVGVANWLAEVQTQIWRAAHPPGANR